MPIVARYSLPRIDEAPIPGVQRTGAPSEAALGGEIGGTLEQSGSQLTGQAYQIAAEAKLQADQIGALKAESDLAGKVTEYLYNPQQGALTKTGANAFSLPEDSQDWWTKTSGEIRATLATDRQRLAFDRAAKGRQLEFQADVMHHVANQTKLYAQDTMTGAVQNFQAEAVTHASEPNRVELSIARQQAAILDGSKGLPPEEVKRRVDLAASQTYTGVINALIAKGQDQQAQATFDQVKDKLGEQLPAVEHAVREHSLLGEAQRQADAIMVTKPATVQDAVDAADKIQDPEVRKLATAQIRQSFAIKKQAAAEESEQHVTQAGNMIDQDPVNGLQRVQRQPWWGDLRIEQKDTIDQYAKKKQLGRLQTDPRTYQYLMNLSSAQDTRDDFAKMDLFSKYGADLSKPDMDHFLEIQASIRKNDAGKEAALLSGEKRRNEIINGALISIGLDPTQVEPGNTRYNSTTAAQVVSFKRQVRDWEAGQQSKPGGKPVTEPELQQEVDRLIVKGALPGTGSGFPWYSKPTTKFAFEVSPDQPLVVDYKDMPAGLVAELSRSLTKQGITVNEKSIMTLYNATKGVLPTIPPVTPAPALVPMTPVKSH